MTTFFTSDTHFGHARINELANRPFDSVEEMNETLIENWNSVVKADDRVIILGDLCMGTIAESLPLVKRLQGDKTLICGNHDRPWIGNGPKATQWFGRYMEVGLDLHPVGTTRRRSECVYEFDGFPHVLLLSHFPYSGDSHDEDRYTDWRPVDNGLWLLHGHTHSKERFTGERQFHVGVDANNFTPISEDEIVELIRAHS